MIKLRIFMHLWGNRYSVFFSNISRVKQFSIQALLLLFLCVFKDTNLHKNPQPGDNRLWNTRTY